MVIEMVTKQNEGHIIVTAPVLIPGEPDCDFNRGEKPLSEKQVADIAHSFMQYGIIDQNHDYFSSQKSVGVPIESYILKETTSLKSLDGSVRDYPPGTWMLSSRITDREVIEKVEKGIHTGYSGTFLPAEYAKKLTNKASMKSSANLRIMDLENPVAYTVSLVPKPCVGGAKFCGLSQKEDNGEKMSENSTIQTIKHIFSTKGENEEAEVMVTKADFDEFKEEMTSIFVEGFEMVAKSLAEPKVEASEKSCKSNNKPKKEEEAKAGGGSSETSEEDSETTSETKSTEDSEATSDNKKEEEETEEEDKKKKVSSKGAKIHNKEIKVTKSDTQTVYDIMGRDSMGSAIMK